MGKHYRHVTIEERCEMARLLAQGQSVRQIAASLDRSPSTVAREVKRNGSRTQGYHPVYANQQAHAHETIYRFIYAQLARKKEYPWRHFLPRAKSKRGNRGRRGGSPASFIAMRRPLDERPQSAADRRTPGHWEADLMLFRNHSQAVLTLHERSSRILIALRPPGKASAPIAEAMVQVLGQLPPQWRRTVTFDNGTEFVRHHHLHVLGIETFFCDTHSPWQKGGVENAIGRLRRTLPRKTDLASMSDDRFNDLIRAYNNTPRKCLEYMTPAEVFLDQVLHLKCERTFPPAETFA